MQLLYTLNSPYARKVRIVALEKHITLTLQEVLLSDPANSVKNHNPLGKIPVLILDDASSVYDSRVIVEYLDNHAPGTHLIPTDNRNKILVRRWEALCDGICDAAVSVMLEERKPIERQSQAHIDRQLEKVTRGLAALNADIAKKKWCVNESFSLADIALGCMLGYVDLRFKPLHWQDSYLHLAKHYSVLVKRPSFKQTLPVAG
jgi:glutathione S-transferase